MNWIKKHADAVVVLVAIVSATMWMQSSIYNGKIELTNKIAMVEEKLDKRLTSLEKEVAIIKTVMLMQGHLPKELVAAKTD